MARGLSMATATPCAQRATAAICHGDGRQARGGTKHTHTQTPHLTYRHTHTHTRHTHKHTNTHTHHTSDIHTHTHTHKHTHTHTHTHYTHTHTQSVCSSGTLIYCGRVCVHQGHSYTLCWSVCLFGHFFIWIIYA